MPQTHSLKNAYRDMWEVFGKKKADCYNQRKFLPINRVGLTNFIREEALLRMVLAVEPKDGARHRMCLRPAGLCPRSLL